MGPQQFQEEYNYNREDAGLESSNNDYEVTLKKAMSKHTKRRLLDIVIQVLTMVTNNAKFYARQSTRKNSGRVLIPKFLTLLKSLTTKTIYIHTCPTVIH